MINVPLAKSGTGTLHELNAEIMVPVGAGYPLTLRVPARTINSLAAHGSSRICKNQNKFKKRIICNNSDELLIDFTFDDLNAVPRNVEIHLQGKL